MHEQYIENGEFWFEKSAAIDELIDLAIDAERISYCSATADSGGPSGGKLEPTLLETVTRLTGANQAYALEPTRECEQQKSVDEFATALEQRIQEAEEEFTRLKQALNAYRKKLRCPKQRRAFGLICAGTAPGEPKLTGAAIAVKCKVSEATVSKLRAQFDKTARRFFALYALPEESASTPDAPDDAAPDTTLEASWHDEPEALDAVEVEVDKKGNPAELKGELSLAPLQGGAGVHDVDSDCPESVASSYARSKANERLIGGGRGGRRKYDELELVTGGSGGRKATYKERVEMSKPAERMDRTNFDKRFASTAARHLRQKARESGYDIDGTLRIIDARIAHKCPELKIAETELAALLSVRRAEVLKNENLAELAWIWRWCKEQRVSPNDLLGSTTLDAVIGATIAPKRRDQ